MANSQHVQQLRAGSASWNAWRQAHPDVKPDLDSADLSGADLSGANLHEARLFEANLSNANLSKADLSSSELWRATLDRAELGDANLQAANATGASFRFVSLVRANLCLTNFELADLRGANLHHAELGRTLLIDTDLSGATQLETCIFWAPAGIDMRTLIRSALLPARFLRGCGVPEEVIENLPVLFGKTIEHYSVLIKSADEDATLAERLSADLPLRGIRCWRANPTPASGAQAALRGRLESSFLPSETRMILVLSRSTAPIRMASLNRDLKLVLQNERVHNRRLLFPIRVDDSKLGLADPSTEQELNRHALDFRRWKEPAFYARALDKLVSALLS